MKYIIFSLFLVFVSCKLDTTEKENNSNNETTWKAKFPALWSVAYAQEPNLNPENVTYEQFLNSLSAKLKEDNSFIEQVSRPANYEIYPLDIRNHYQCSVSGKTCARKFLPTTTSANASLGVYVTKPTIEVPANADTVERIDLLLPLQRTETVKDSLNIDAYKQNTTNSNTFFQNMKLYLFQFSFVLPDETDKVSFNLYLDYLSNSSLISDYECTVLNSYSGATTGFTYDKISKLFTINNPASGIPGRNITVTCKDHLPHDSKGYVTIERKSDHLGGNMEIMFSNAIVKNITQN